MTYQEIVEQIRSKRSFLCLGLDSDISLIPKHLLQLSDPLFEFNKQVIDATHTLTIAYKPNIAFYECLGSTGWISLEKTVRYIKDKYPEIFVIADAKRGDIGNTSAMYAKAFFENMPCDAITVTPYMGKDSIKPFLNIKNKWTIVLAITSNSGSSDFQFLFDCDEGMHLFEKVLFEAKSWGDKENIMFVAGATQPKILRMVREIVPEHFLLIPGIGAQGGDLNEVAQNSLTPDVGIIVNSSRAIIYASDKEDFADRAYEKALEVQQQMDLLLQSK